MLLHFNKQNKLNYFMLLMLVAFSLLIGTARTAAAATEENSNIIEDAVKIPVDDKPSQKTYKKDLKENITNETVIAITPAVKDNHTEKLVIIDDKSLIETSGNTLAQQTSLQQDALPKGSEKPVVSKTITKPKEPIDQHQHHVDDDFVLSDDVSESESLKTGFYFFLILSTGAILFVLFKIYRLRLSRAERRYGVQGDRSTQELTPLPISMEDGHSDDEDHTVFELQRQTIKIL